MKYLVLAMAIAACSPTQPESIIGISQIEDTRVSNSLNLVHSRNVTCLALNIYHEARGSSRLDQLGVASVTLNRVDSKRWPDTVCGVVYQPWAFSWTMDSLSDKPYNKEAYKKAKEIANGMIVGQLQRVTRANHYYNPTHASPKWSVGKPYKIIGSHKYLSL